MTDKIHNNPFNRPPRIQDAFQALEIEVPAPPVEPEEPARNLLLMLLPMASMVMMGLFYAFAFSGGGSGFGSIYAVMMIGMAVLTFVSSFILYGEQKHQQKQRWIKQLRDYHRLLDKKEFACSLGASCKAICWSNVFLHQLKLSVA